MILAVDCLADLESPLEAFPGFLELAQVFQDRSEVVDSDGHVGMIWAVDLLVDLESPLEAFPGIFKLAACLHMRACLV